MTIYIQPTGFRDGVATHDALVAMAQFQARYALDAVAPITNSIGGTPSATYAIAAVAADAVNEAASGSDLADKTTTEAALGTVRDALNEVFAKYNSAAALVGFPSITNSSGGAAADGTAGAVTVSVTGAATGGQAADLNVALAAIANATYNAAAAVNKVAKAAGTPTLVVAPEAAGTALSTIPAYAITVGTAATPGVKKAVVDAKLVALRTNLTTLAATLNLALAGAGAAPVVATV